MLPTIAVIYPRKDRFTIPGGGAAPSSLPGLSVTHPQELAPLKPILTTKIRIQMQNIHMYMKLVHTSDKFN